MTSPIDMMKAAIFGNPPQANWKPDRQGVLDAYRRLTDMVGNISFASLIDASYANKSLIDADLAHGDGTVAIVYSDSIKTNNDIYVKSGASGSGHWVNTHVFRDMVEIWTQDAIDAANSAQLSETIASASASDAALQATRAEEYAASQLAGATGIYPNLIAGAAAVAEGGYFFVSDGVSFYTARKVSGVGVKQAVFHTDRSLRQMVSEGLPILSMGTESAVTNDALDYIREFNDAAKSYGGGKLIFPGKGYEFQLATDYATYGTLTYPDGTTVPFKRGKIALVSNTQYVGNGARIFHAPGEHDSGGMFYTPFWLDDGQIDNVMFEGLDIDGNYLNQTFTQYAAQNTDAGLWMHGHGIYGGSLTRLLTKRCKIHGFWGHGVFGFSAVDFGKTTNYYALIQNDIYDNLQGGAQCALNWFHSERNRYHGNFGWTGIGFNIEVSRADEAACYLRSINDTFDARDGLSTPYATLASVNGFTGVATDSAEAASYRVMRRRGAMFGGDYYELSPNTGQRVDVQITGARAYECSVCVAGWEGVIINDYRAKSTYQANLDRYFPPVNNLLTVVPGGDFYDQLVQATLTGIQIDCDEDKYPIYVRNYSQLRLEATVKGGRNAAVRMENCGGRIDLIAQDFGSLAKESGYAADQIGAQTSAITAFGISGPLDINVQALETRSGAARQVNYAAYLNVSTTFPCVIRGSSTGQLIAPIHDVNNSVIALGLVDGVTRTVTTNRKPTLTAGLDVTGVTDLRSMDGSGALNLHAPNGQNNYISFFNGGTYHGQLMQRGEDSGMQVNLATPTSSVTPIQFQPDGSVFISAKWQMPLQTNYGQLWVSAGGILRISGSTPTSDSDGVAVGSQT